MYHQFLIVSAFNDLAHCEFGNVSSGHNSMSHFKFEYFFAIKVIFTQKLTVLANMMMMMAVIMMGMMMGMMIMMGMMVIEMMVMVARV